MKTFFSFFFFKGLWPIKSGFIDGRLDFDVTRSHHLFTFEAKIMWRSEDMSENEVQYGYFVGNCGSKTKTISVNQFKL